MLLFVAKNMFKLTIIFQHNTVDTSTNSTFRADKTPVSAQMTASLLFQDCAVSRQAIQSTNRGVGQSTGAKIATRHNSGRLIRQLGYMYPH